MSDSSGPRKSGKLGVAIVLVLAAAVGAGVWSDRDATEQAEAFCGTIAPGDEAAPIEARARTGGAQQLTRRAVGAGAEELYVIYAGVPLGIRAMCVVEIADGRVVGTRTGPLD